MSEQLDFSVYSCRFVPLRSIYLFVLDEREGTKSTFLHFLPFGQVLGCGSDHLSTTPTSEDFVRILSQRLN